MVEGEEVLQLSLIGLLGFATVVLVAVSLLHGYLWWRLVRSTTRPGRTRRLLTLGVVVLAVLPMGAVLLRREDSALSTVVQWVGFSWLGVAFYLTPVFYGLRTVPDRYDWILHLNPMTTLIEGYRAALLGTAAPSIGALVGVTAFSASIAAAGFVAFRRLEPRFADQL